MGISGIINVVSIILHRQFVCRPQFNRAFWMLKILVIEDEWLLADSIKSMLDRKGFQVEWVYDGLRQG